MGLELQLENVVFVDAISLRGDTHAVAQQREAGQGVVILGDIGSRDYLYRQITGRGA